MNYMGGRIAFVVSGTGTMFTCTWIFSKRFRNLIEDKANVIHRIYVATYLFIFLPSFTLCLSCIDPFYSINSIEINRILLEIGI